MYNLTETEKQVLYYITRGYNNTEIGAILYISKHTAKSHVSSIIRKTNSRSRSQAAFLACKYSLC